MIERAKSLYKNTFTWYTLTSFLLYLIIILVLVILIVKLDRGLQLNSLRILMLQATAFGLIISIFKKLQRPIIIILLTFFSGMVASFLLIGNLVEPLIDLTKTILNSLAIYWKYFFRELTSYPDFGLLEEKWAVLKQATGVLSDRVGNWLVALPEPAYDPVSMNIIGGIALWIISFWIFWFVVKRKQVLAGIFPPLIIITNVYRYADVSIFSLFWILGIGLLLNLLANQARHEEFWIQNRLSISWGIRRKTIQYSITLSLGLVLLSGLITSPRLDEFIKDIRQRRQSASNSSVSPSKADGETFLGETGPSEVLGEAAFGKFPNTHLVGSGPELSETEVMYVHINDPSSQGTGRYYLRSATYDTYTLHGWLTVDKGFILFQPSSVSAVDYTPNEKLIFQVVSLLEDHEQGNLMYTVGELAASDVTYFASFHTKFKNDTYTDIFASVTQETQYSAYSVVPHFGVDELRESAMDYPAWITSKYLQIPEEVPDRVYNLSLRLTATEPTPYDRALAIEQYLRGFEYTLDLEAPPGYHDLVDYFIFELKKGYCDYFASSMVVLARAAGIPARLVTGYAASTYDPVRNQYIVTADQAHSWAELYFSGFGWVTFEPTPGRPAVDRLDQREEIPEIQADQLEIDGPDRNFAESLSRLVPDNLFILSSQVAIVAVLGIVASHWIEFWTLKKIHPDKMFPRLYRRMRRSTKKLRLKTRETDTPLEFSEMLESHLTKLGSNRLLANVLDLVPQTTTMVIGTCNQAAYAKQLPSDEEINAVISAWRWLRWRFFLTRILIQLLPVHRSLRRLRNRLS